MVDKPKVVVTDDSSVARRLAEKIVRNSVLPIHVSSNYVFYDTAVAEAITEEAIIARKRIDDFFDMSNLIVVGNGGAPMLHHEIPTHMPIIAYKHDKEDAKVGDLSKDFSKNIRKNLDLSNIIVSLQSNNQKDQS